MHEDIEKRLKIAAGSTPDNGSFDEVWLRATQIQRRRAGVFSAVAAALSLVVVMSAGALTAPSDLQDHGVGMPAGSPGPESPAPASVTVPDVTGLPVALAQEILRDAGLEPILVPDNAVGREPLGELECGPVPWSNKKGPKGVEISIRCSFRGEVLSQSPPVGTTVPVGSEVRIEPSGPTDVIFQKRRELRSEMRDLDRRLRKEARRALSKARAGEND